jgi:ubiquinol-cytochrome c reductase cytochrome c subunit
MYSTLKFCLAVFAALSVFNGDSVFAASAENGKAAFVKHGCWQCHGFSGQGGSAGLKLAPDPKPLEAIMGFVRSTDGPMPPFSEKILSDEDVADIYAYLSSIPKARDYKSIPLLGQ